MSTPSTMPLHEDLLPRHVADAQAASQSPAWAERAFGLHAVLALCVAVLILMAVPRSMADPDIWWHLRNAQQMLSGHAFVRADGFSFTVAGAPWIDHEWLSELPFLLGWKLAGSTGVFAVKALLIEGIFLPVMWLCWRASGSMLTACAATVVAALLGTVSFGPRTLLFGWLCLVLELVVLERFRTDARFALALPPLFLLWVNLHGSWMIGLGVLLLVSAAGHVQVRRGALAADAFTPGQSRMLAWSWAGTLAALFCNPWGLRLVAYPFNFAFHQTLNVASVEEWHSLDLHTFRGRLVIAAVALLAGRQLWKPRNWTLVELALLGLGLYSALVYTRFLFLLALLAAPVAAGSFPASDSPARSGPALLRVHALLMVAILGVTGVYLRKQGFESDATMQRFPSAAAMRAVAQIPPSSRVFNEFLWGGYLEWNQPDRPVFIDSRVDIFEYSGVFKDYLDIVHIDGTLALLDKYRIDYVLFERDTPLAYLLRHSGGWAEAYQDEQTMLWRRSVPAR